MFVLVVLEISYGESGRFRLFPVPKYDTMGKKAIAYSILFFWAISLGGILNFCGIPEKSIEKQLRELNESDANLPPIIQDNVDLSRPTQDMLLVPAPVFEADDVK